MRRPVLLTLVAALALALHGCGEDPAPPSVEDYRPEASTTMRAVEVTKPQFVRRVNGFCRQAWPAIAENIEDFRKAREPEQRSFADVVRVPLLTGIVFHIFDAIRILGAPPGEERRIEAIVGPMQVSSELGQKGLVPLPTAASIPDHYRVYNKRARAYGLRDCLVTTSRVRALLGSA